MDKNSKFGESAEYRAQYEAALKGSNNAAQGSGSRKSENEVSNGDAERIRGKIDMENLAEKARGTLCKDISGGSHCDDVASQAAKASGQVKSKQR